MSVVALARYLDDRSASSLGLDALARLGDLALGLRTDWTTWSLGIELHVEPYPHEADHRGSVSITAGPFTAFAQLETELFS